MRHRTCQQGRKMRGQGMSTARIGGTWIAAPSMEWEDAETKPQKQQRGGGRETIWRVGEVGWTQEEHLEEPEEIGEGGKQGSGVVVGGYNFEDAAMDSNDTREGGGRAWIEKRRRERDGQPVGKPGRQFLRSGR